MKKIKCFIIIFFVIADQLIKSIIINNMIQNTSIELIYKYIKITYVINLGGAYSIGSNNSWIILGFSIIVIAFLVCYFITKYNKLNQLQFYGLSLILGGGIGNLIDRVFRGYVIDYIDVRGLFEFPIFNFADICVVIGTIIIILGLIVEEHKKQEI